MKVGNLVRMVSKLSSRGLGIVIDLESVQYAHAVRVKWNRDGTPPLMYRVQDLKVVSEAK
jgi:hypothetical protein|tara:strand:+ start:141 stop:320 length:180 start_codon:yes stop_codon:yes gene_type:complete